MKKLYPFTVLVVATFVLVMPCMLAMAQEIRGTVLVGSQEIPAVSTAGVGLFVAQVFDSSIDMQTLIYASLEGSVTRAHIHLGQRGVAGAILINICGEPSTPTCPAPGTPLTRTLTAADVPGITTQGIPAGGIAEAIRMIRAGLTYANVHTSVSPAGEIRGQLEP